MIKISKIFANIAIRLHYLKGWLCVCVCGGGGLITCQLVRNNIGKNIIIIKWLYHIRRLIAKLLAPHLLVQLSINTGKVY